MAWSNEELTKFQDENNLKLKEINESLRPDSGEKTGKIGIFCFGQVGDLATAMSVLKYRNELWPNKEIIWYANWPNADLLRYAPISEVRPWLWAGNGLPEGSHDYWPMLCDSNNRLNKELAKNYEGTADLEDGYFPAPHQLSPEKRTGLDYPNVSRKVFGVPEDKEWHPYLRFSSEDHAHVDKAALKLPLRKCVMIENFCGSGQSLWDDLMTVRTIEICREAWGECNFFFASHKNTWQFKDFEGYYSLANLTPRQVGLFIEFTDLFVGISSGISVTTSYWQSRPTPKIQFCGSHTCSTVTLATGEISLITSDNKPLEESKKEFFIKLKEVISRIG